MSEEQIKAIMLEDIEQSLDDWYCAHEANDKALALQCREIYMAKVALYEKVFEGEIVYYNDRKVYVEKE